MAPSIPLARPTLNGEWANPAQPSPDPELAAILRDVWENLPPGWREADRPRLRAAEWVAAHRADDAEGVSLADAYKLIRFMGTNPTGRGADRRKVEKLFRGERDFFGSLAAIVAGAGLVNRALSKFKLSRCKPGFGGIPLTAASRLDRLLRRPPFHKAGCGRVGGFGYWQSRGVAPLAKMLEAAAEYQYLFGLPATAHAVNAEGGAAVRLWLWPCVWSGPWYWWASEFGTPAARHYWGAWASQMDPATVADFPCGDRRSGNPR